MSHESNTLNATAETASPAPEPPVTRVEAPDFITRAGRILGGDVRPDDYLPEPDEVREAVANEVQRLAENEGIDAAPEVRRRLLNDWTLSFVYGGGPVACRRMDAGVLVFAVGLDSIQRFLETLSRPEQRPGVVITTPPLWQPPVHSDSPNH